MRLIGSVIALLLFALAARSLPVTAQAGPTLDPLQTNGQPKPEIWNLKSEI